MTRIGWFTPISAETGIASYSRNVLEEMARRFGSDEIGVTVFHPATGTETLRMPYPSIELSDALLRSDFGALFDVAVYHLGNNDRNHGPIYDALLRHSGVVVLHDHVYQHYLAGLGVAQGFVSSSFGSLVHEAGGPEAFAFLDESGALRCDRGAVRFLPWESGWAIRVPLGDRLARLGLGAVVHSEFARQGLGSDYPSPIARLFMPRPGDGPVPLPAETALPETRPIHLVCCGHIGPTKGIGLLVTAFRADPALRTRFRVTIAGFGSDPAYLQALRNDLAAADLGAVFDLRLAPPEAEYRAIMASADIFYNLRYPNTEGASLSLTEQLGIGRPVIAYRTGCFAEIPEDACYFLDRINDSGALLALLHDIDSGRAQIRHRGARARQSVEDRTAARYADDLAGFLREHSETFRRRSRLLDTRRRGENPAPRTAEDAAWLKDYTGAVSTLRAVFRDAHHLPRGFFGLSAAERGRFIAANLLHVRIGPEREARIGALLGGLSPVRAHAVLGRLAMLSARHHLGRSFLPSHLEAMAPFAVDLDLWRMLAVLTPEQAVPLALLALGREADPEAVAQILDAASGQDCKRALTEVLGPDIASGHSRALRDWLETPDPKELDAVPPLPPDTEIFAFERSGSNSGMVWFRGFHDMEEIGAWTAKPAACIYLNASNAVTALAAEGLVLTAADPAVYLSVTEMRSGRRAAAEAGPQDDAPHARLWQMALPDFSGPLCISIEAGRLISPREAGLSADARPLGVLMSRMILS